MEHKRSGAGGSGSDSELNKRTPEGSRLSGGFLCCTNFTRPTGALDSNATEELLKLFSEINRNGQTILMVTHSVKAASHAGRVLFIKDGEVFHQIYRGNSTDEQLYQKISDTLTALASKKFQGGEGR